MYQDTLEKAFDPTGRATTKEYFTFIFINTIIIIVFSYLFKDLKWASIITAFIAFVLTICLGFRRAHDIGINGWWSLLPSVLLILAFIFRNELPFMMRGGMLALALVAGMALLLVKGQKGKNKYGEKIVLVNSNQKFSLFNFISLIFLLIFIGIVVYVISN